MNWWSVSWNVWHRIRIQVSTRIPLATPFIPLATVLAVNQFKASSLITQPLVSLTQQHTEGPVSPDQAGNINAIQMHQRKETSKHHREKQQEEVKALKQTLPAALQKSLELASEKGASAWLTTLPIEEHGFSLHKQAFRDTLCVRYGWEPTRLPSHCSCGAQFTTTHAFSCSKGAFPSIWHIKFEMWQPNCSLRSVIMSR